MSLGEDETVGTLFEMGLGYGPVHETEDVSVGRPVRAEMVAVDPARREGDDRGGAFGARRGEVDIEEMVVRPQLAEDLQVARRRNPPRR